jgi:hypothetical protein
MRFRPLTFPIGTCIFRPPVEFKSVHRSTLNFDRLITSALSPNVQSLVQIRALRGLSAHVKIIFCDFFVIFFVMQTGRTAQPVFIPYTSFDAD